MAVRERVEQEYKKRFGQPPERLIRSPGRVNVLGGHVDYSDGFVLPGAIEPSLYLAVGQPADAAAPCWQVTALDREGSSDIKIDPALPPLAERDNSPEVTWADYVGGVAWALALSGRTPPPMRAVFASEIPIGAGVSSSAALEVAFLMAAEALSDPETFRSLSGVCKAKLGRRVENEYLGLGSGIMDQFACVHGQEQSLILLDCRTLEHQMLALPGDVMVLVTDSRVRRRLVGSGFNDRRSVCEQAVARLRVELPEITHLRDVSPAQLDEHMGLLSEEMQKRARHAVSEMARVQAGAEHLRQGDLAALGECMKESHRSSRDDYQVTIPELDRLAEVAWETPGCYGARLAGGGFGGCVLSLVDQDAVDELEQNQAAMFEAEFSVTPGFLRTGIAGGAEFVG